MTKLTDLPEELHRRIFELAICSTPPARAFNIKGRVLRKLDDKSTGRFDIALKLAQICHRLHITTIDVLKTVIKKIASHLQLLEQLYPLVFISWVKAEYRFLRALDHRGNTIRDDYESSSDIDKERDYPEIYVLELAYKKCRSHIDNLRVQRWETWYELTLGIVPLLEKLGFQVAHALDIPFMLHFHLDRPPQQRARIVEGKVAAFDVDKRWLQICHDQDWINSTWTVESHTADGRRFRQVRLDYGNDHERLSYIY